MMEGSSAELERKLKRRRVARKMLVLVALVLMTVGIVAAFQTSPGKSSSSVATDRISLNFGYSLKPITRTLRVNLCDLPGKDLYSECDADRPPGATRPDVLAAIVDSDLQVANDDSQFPANQLTVTATNTGRTALLVSVTADPQSPDDVEPGTYDGKITIERGGDSADIPLTVNVKLLERDGGVRLWAIAALAIGAFAGTLLKWIDTTFAPMSGLRRRQRRLDNQLLPYAGELPGGAARRLDDVRLAIQTLDPDGVGTALDLIAQNQDALIAFATTTRSMKAHLASQEAMRDAGGLNWVADAIVVEHEFIEQFRQKVWPWDSAETAQTALGNADGWMRKLTALMRQYEITGSPTDQAKVEAFAAVMVRGGPSALEGALPSEDALEAAPRDFRQDVNRSVFESMNMDRTTLLELPRRTPILWLLDNAWWIMLLAIAATVVAFGYQSQFLENVDFEAEPLDYFKMAGWAFAIQIAGGTVLETVGRIRTSGPGAPQ